MEIGFLGTGHMGGPMVRRLLGAGHAVTVYDVRRDATRALETAGARWAGSPRQVAERSHVVFSSVPGPDEVETIFFDPNAGILGGLRPGSIYVDTSTSSPELARRIAAACRDGGFAFLDAPCSGGPAGAEDGTLTFMVGGDAGTLERCRPVLGSLGTTILHVGEAGCGMVAKLVVQHLFYANLVAAAEALLMGTKGGIPLADLAQVVATSGGNSRAFEMVPRVLFSGNFGRLISLNVAIKDLVLARDLAERTQSPTAVLDTVEGVMREALSRGWGDQGFLHALDVLAERAGVELRVPAEGEKPVQVTR